MASHASLEKSKSEGDIVMAPHSCHPSRPKLPGTYEGKILDSSRESPVLDKKDVLDRCPA